MFQTHRPRQEIATGRKTARVLLIAIVCIVISVPLIAQIPIVIPLLGSASAMEIPGGSPVLMEDLDGVLGPEWTDSFQSTMRLGRYNTTVYQKRDGTYLYLAMVIETNRSFPRGFEAFLIFDDGDLKDYERGDDMLLVQEDNGEVGDADYYYMDLYDYRLDRRVAGQTNAYGAGKYDEESRQYVFEFMKELESGDIRDRQLCTGCDFLVIYGWASY